MKVKSRIRTLCLLLFSILLIIVLLEVAIRIYHSVWKPSNIKQRARQEQEQLYVILDSPYLYGLNPDHHDINSLGLRDDEITISKPEGGRRILILGDSVTFGTFVPRNSSYPNHLEQLFRRQYEAVEVINAGVGGYSAFNELQYYLTEGRKFQSDIVIVAFCMNDVVNPRLHWGFRKKKKMNIPQEAIPNVDHDENYALPLSKKKENAIHSLLMRSKLYNTMHWRVKILLHRFTKPEIPTHITGNDTTSIRVLLDKTSPEFKWLTSTYGRLRDAVRSDGAEFLVLLFPLAYQLDENYPYQPQKLISRYCAENNIHCIDLLDTFRQYRKQDIFLLEKSGYDDVWHLTETGHEVAAEKIYEWLEKAD